MIHNPLPSACIFTEGIQRVHTERNPNLMQTQHTSLFNAKHKSQKKIIIITISLLRKLVCCLAN